MQITLGRLPKGCWGLSWTRVLLRDHSGNLKIVKFRHRSRVFNLSINIFCTSTAQKTHPYSWNHWTKDYGRKFSVIVRPSRPDLKPQEHELVNNLTHSTFLWSCSNFVASTQEVAVNRYANSHWYKCKPQYPNIIGHRARMAWVWPHWGYLGPGLLPGLLPRRTLSRVGELNND